MYLSNWKQKNFEEFQKKYSSIFDSLPSKKLDKIDMNKKNKVGFCSLTLNNIQLFTLESS